MGTIPPYLTIDDAIEDLGDKIAYIHHGAKWGLSSTTCGGTVLATSGNTLLEALNKLLYELAGREEAWQRLQN